MIRSVGIIGAGKLGVVLAQLANKAGYSVYIAGSGDPEDIRLSMSILTPQSHVVDRETLVKHCDMIILAIPLSKFRNIPRDTLTDKLIIDAMNYWREVDGEKDTILDPLLSSSEQVQKYFKSAHVVKALNHVGYHDLYDHATNKGNPDRRAVAVAGGNTDTSAVVCELINSLGFDPLPIGSLINGTLLEPGGSVFGISVTASELKRLLAV